MNKKGQVATIIESFPVIIMVFIVMLLFIILTGFISFSHGLKEQKPMIYSSNSDLLLQEINIKVGDVVQKKMVFDVLFQAANENELNKNYGGLLTALDSFMVSQKKETCALLYAGTFDQAGLIFECEVIKDPVQQKDDLLQNGERNACKGFTLNLDQGEGMASIYGEAISKNTFFTNSNQRNEVFYYYGLCLHEVQK